MSKMLLHELHPSVVHAPLALLPTAMIADLIAVTSGDRSWAKVGRRLWVAGTASALFAGVAGLAASQQVRMREPVARDMVFTHGSLNALVTVGAVGLTAWRLLRRPSRGSCVVALLANGMALYTATLGGKMVYELGVGINPMPTDSPQGTLKGPALFSREAPAALFRDALRGIRWLLSRARSLKDVPFAPGAEGVRDNPPVMPIDPVSTGASDPRGLSPLS